ncbi:MAG: esterase family protein [Alphaproteobacteria bacterium]|nr:esterase family protein [Alphaproteobacteria bacterium]
MKPAIAVALGPLLAAAAVLPAAAAETACVTGGASVPAGANTTDRAAPFFIDTTGLDLRTSPPTRDPSNPDYPHARELPDGTLPQAGAEGNFIIGPTHTRAPQTVAQADVPHGTLRSFTLSSQDSVIYNPGMIRDDPPHCRDGAARAAHAMPGDPSNLVLTASHAGRWERTIDVYVPAEYVHGEEAPFIVFGDGSAAGFYPGRDLFTTLDNLIHAHRLPPMIAIGIGAGGQNAQGSERGREYDAVSGAYAEWVEREVLPRVEQVADVRLTKDPDGRATMGISSSGAAAFTMAWFHPELYHRVLAYSPTMVNQQWPHDPSLPGGAWEYHDPWPGPATPAETVTALAVAPTTAPAGAPLIPNSPARPIRFWFEVGDRDLFYPMPNMPDGMHDWVLADERMAAVLAAKGYHYQFVFARNAVHVDRPTVAQTLPEALEWLWQGYPGR